MATKKPAGKYHSISVVAKAGGCAAAKRCASERFLSHKAPKLPLPECDRPGSCACVYQHHTDRRDDPRRTSDDGGPVPLMAPVNERRMRRGKRTSDR
jgi:hypothetical protein